MIDGYLLLVEGAAIAAPTLATATYALRGRKRLRTRLREPLFWDGGQPVSLVTLHNELNGEADLPGALCELLNVPAPLTRAQLDRAVALLQSDPAACRRLVLDVATDVALKGTVPATGAPASAGVALMERLSESSVQLGFFAFIATLNAERPVRLPALLPIDALLPGGMAVAPPPGPFGADMVAGPAGVLGVLSALGLARQGDWLPGVVKAVEDMVRERRLKKARDQYQRALVTLGAATSEALRRKSPAGQQLRRNIYSPLDAYRNLQTRSKAAWKQPGRGRSFLVPTVELGLQRAFEESMMRATAVVADKCGSLERTLLGREGQAYAGEVLYRHRESLLVSVAPDAFPLSPVDVALEEYMRMKHEKSPHDG